MPRPASSGTRDASSCASPVGLRLAPSWAAYHRIEVAVPEAVKRLRLVDLRQGIQPDRGPRRRDPAFEHRPSDRGIRLYASSSRDINGVCAQAGPARSR